MPRSTKSIGITAEILDVTEPEESEEITLVSLIKELDDGSIDSNKLTDHVIDAILGDKPSLARHYLRPTIANQVQILRRMATSKKERTVDAEIRVAVDPSVARKKLVKECFISRVPVLFPGSRLLRNSTWKRPRDQR